MDTQNIRNVPTSKAIKMAFKRERLFLFGTVLIAFTWYLQTCRLEKMTSEVVVIKEALAKYNRNAEDLNNEKFYQHSIKLHEQNFQSNDFVDIYKQYLTTYLSTLYTLASISNDILYGFRSPDRDSVNYKLTRIAYNSGNSTQEMDISRISDEIRKQDAIYQSNNAKTQDAALHKIKNLNDEMDHETFGYFLLYVVGSVALAGAKANKYFRNEIKDTPETLEDIEREYILKVLKKVNWKIGGEKGAAKILGLNANTLEAKMKKFGIKRDI